MLEDVVDERVHDAIGVRMNLLQHFVHVDSIALLPGLSAFLSSFTGVPMKPATHRIVLPIIYLYCFKHKFMVRAAVDG